MALFSSKEYQRRVRSIKEAMKKGKFDVLLVTKPENIYYVSGLRTVGSGISPNPHNMPYMLAIPLDGDPRLMVRMVEQATVGHYTWTKNNVFWWDYENPYKLVKKVLDEEKVSKGGVGIETNSWYMPVRTYENLKKVLPNGTFKDASGLIDNIRIVKSEEEIKYVKESGRLTNIGMKAAIEAVREGVHGYEVAAEALHALYKNGQDENCCQYCTVNSGPTGGYAHDTLKNRKIRKGDTVVIELNGCCHLYGTNAVATLFVGDIPGGMKKAHKVTMKLFNKCSEALRPGVPTEEVWAVADRVFVESGYGHFYRRLGFSNGICSPPTLWIGEFFDITKGEKRKLQPGMVLSIEPGAGSFVGGKGSGTIVGCNFLITKKGHEMITGPFTELYRK